MSVQFNESDLENFTGTMKYYRSSLLFPDIVHTDGVQFVAERGGAWMLDVIVSHQIKSAVHDQEFQVWEFLVKEDGKCQVLCSDGETEAHLTKQDIPYTDLPFDMKFFLQLGSLDLVTPAWVIMLPNEY